MSDYNYKAIVTDCTKATVQNWTKNRSGSTVGGG